jgi:hypothetical protein
VNNHDYDAEARDAIHMMPLGILPVKTEGLRRAVMVKNARFESMIELFREKMTGRGQVQVPDVPRLFTGQMQHMRGDIELLSMVAGIKSFDVYSLRLELRRLEIPVENEKYLSLSAKKRQQLSGYMNEFTRPLVAQVFGGSSAQSHSIGDVSQIYGMLTSPNRADALKNLEMMSRSLEVPLTEIPSFLENYGDIFLSLAFYRQCHDTLVPDVEKMISWMREVRDSYQVRVDRGAQRVIDKIESDLREIVTSMTGRFENFDNLTRTFWSNINAVSFQEVKELILAHHVSIGGVLCGMLVKLDTWRERFGGYSGGGGPQRRLEFIRGELLPGLGDIKSVESSARSGLWATSK